MSINPAFTGDINGEFRIGFLYRNQWNSISSPFVSSTLFSDKKFLEDKLKGDYVGGGINLVSDQTGSGSLSMINIGLNVSYHHFINKKMTKKIFGGVQLGAFQKSINPALLVFENQFNYTDADFTGVSNGETFISNNITKPDAQAGVAYWYNSKKYYITAGLSAAHLNMPNQSFTSQKDRLSPKYIFYAEGQYNFTKFLFMAPSVMVQYQKKSSQFNLGTTINRGFGKKFKENIYLKAGAWYRVGDAVNVLLGINHNNWQFNFTYDINTSKLKSATNTVGAFEIAMVYTHNIFNIQKNKTRTFPCSRFF